MLHPVRDLRDAVGLWAGRASPSPVPVRTVLVSSERLAHAFRRELALDPARRPLLVGTRFLRPVDLAHEVLLRQGEFAADGAEAVAVAALEDLFSGTTLEGKLQYFDLGELRKGAGYAEAAAATLDDLAEAHVDAKALRHAADQATDPVSKGRYRDLATIQESLKIQALRRHDLLRRAAGKDLAYLGPTYVLLEKAPEVSELDFLSAIPGIFAGFLVANPPRKETLEQIEGLASRLGGLGEPSKAPAGGSDELTLLHRFLLAKPEESGSKGRPQSAGPDGSVTMELSSGAAEELEATVDWVAEQVRRETPLERIAVIVPTSDPYAGMVHDRLAGLPWNLKEPPLHVAGGLPLRDFQAGQRMLALLGALESGLRVEEFFRVLPYLRLEGVTESEAPKHLSLADSRALVWTCGTLGGSPERPELGAEWVPGLERRIAHLKTLASMKEVTERNQRDVEAAQRDLKPAEQVLPAVRDLALLLKEVTAATSLEKTWQALRDFWKKRIVVFDTAGMMEALEEKLRPLFGFAEKGGRSLPIIRRSVESLRRSVGRFGEPRVFIGTPDQAAGLPFDAVRMVGLAEGAVAAAPTEDPLLPDLDRAALSGRMTRAGEKPLASLHAVHRLVVHTGKRISLSAPRQTVDGTVREASALYLEAAAALRRPNAVTGLREGQMLVMEALRRDYFEAGREARKTYLAVRPGRPASDDLAAFLAKIMATAPGPLDGLLATNKPPLGVYSPSAIQKFLECPHRFLFERVFRWTEPEVLPDVHELDALTYGSLFHQVLELFFKADGEAFYRHQGKLEAWIEKSEKVANAAFDLVVSFYPLVPGDARDRARERLIGDVERALRHEWDRGPGIQIARIEEPFGYATPVEIEGLKLRGEIDRLDQKDGGTWIRDFKSGKPKPRKAGEPPDPVIDLQVALYSLAVSELAKEWKVEVPTQAAYVYSTARHHVERSFSGDEFALLKTQGRSWLTLVRKMMEEGAYPRTPDKDDCQHCKFKVVCGDAAPSKEDPDVVRAKFAAAPPGPVTEFIQVKTGPANPPTAKSGGKKGAKPTHGK